MTARLLVSTISVEASSLATQALHRLLYRPDARARTQDQGWRPHDAPSHAGQTPLLGFTRMLARAAEESGRSQLGLEMAASEVGPTPSIFGGLFLYAPTLGDALQAMARHFPVSQTGTTIDIARTQGLAHLSYKINDPAVGARLHDAAYTLGKICRSIRRSAGAGWQPERVLLAAPAPRDQEPYRRFFLAPVVFGAVSSGLLFRGETLDQPIATADAARYRDFCAQLEQRMPARGEPGLLAEALRSWLMYATGDGKATLERAAADFGITPRTLQRRLKAQGISFQDLLIQVRMDHARHLLAESRMPVTRIAERLGFSEASAFTRAFRDHTQQSPRAFRQAALAAA